MAAVAQVPLFSGQGGAAEQFSVGLNIPSHILSCSIAMPRSLSNNNIGPEGAAHIGAALKDNTALQMLEYVAPWPPRATAARSAGR